MCPSINKHLGLKMGENRIKAKQEIEINNTYIEQKQGNKNSLTTKLSLKPSNQNKLNDKI